MIAKKHLVKQMIFMNQYVEVDVRSADKMDKETRKIVEFEYCECGNRLTGYDTDIEETRCEGCR
tara:strand:+ start:463 stop:654 length:192 start_codon:yes stop_codon:yes gene_type:complete